MDKQVSNNGNRKKSNNNYIKYPFEPIGSDERQFSSPGLRIPMISFHKSKYCEYDEYHTSKDNLSFISIKSLLETLDLLKYWLSLVEKTKIPFRVVEKCEYQLGKYNLYPTIGGHSNFSEKNFSTNLLSEESIEAFNWVLFLADGKNSNFDISLKSQLPIDKINDAINILENKKLIN